MKETILEGKPQESEFLKILNKDTCYWKIHLKDTHLFYESFMEKSSKKREHELEETDDPKKWYDGFFDNSYLWKRKDIADIEFAYNNSYKGSPTLSIYISNRYRNVLIPLEYEATDKGRKEMERDLEILKNWWLN